MTRKEKLLKKLANKEYRHAWVEESVKSALPFQIQANREKRDWSQAILGEKSDMKQNAVSRLESAEYGNLSINTLLRLGEAFDCGLLVKFVPFSRLVGEFEDVSPRAMEVLSFDDDLQNLESWASASATVLDGEMNENTNSTSVVKSRIKDVTEVKPINTTPAKPSSNLERGWYKRYLEGGSSLLETEVKNEPHCYYAFTVQDLTSTQPN